VAAWEAACRECIKISSNIEDREIKKGPVIGPFFINGYDSSGLCCILFLMIPISPHPNISSSGRGCLKSQPWRISVKSDV
jgi:hypothetical protein